MRSGACCQDKSQESTEASVEDCRTNISQCFDRPFVAVPCLSHEAMSHMGTIVHTETNGYHKINTGDYVNSQTPEVDEPTNVNQCEKNTDQNQETSRDVLDEDNGRDEHTQEGEAHVTPSLESNYLICFPACI